METTRVASQLARASNSTEMDELEYGIVLQSNYVIALNV